MTISECFFPAMEFTEIPESRELRGWHGSFDGDGQRRNLACLLSGATVGVYGKPGWLANLNKNR